MHTERSAFSKSVFLPSSLKYAKNCAFRCIIFNVFKPKKTTRFPIPCTGPHFYKSDSSESPWVCQQLPKREQLKQDKQISVFPPSTHTHIHTHTHTQEKISPFQPCLELIWAKNKASSYEIGIITFKYRGNSGVTNRREMKNTTAFLLFDSAEQWKVPLLLTDASTASRVVWRTAAGSQCVCSCGH